WPYGSAEAALDDALKLSRAMSYKNAMADLDLGGGKSVIIGDSRSQKSPALFEAFGRAVETLGGRYWTAEDVGVSPADLASART
ncbi:Glu/Leu/Phe/Val dehydrogenase dimerization domain-containing protein, partial [Klebsiella pneumoniae]|uniref:Glu/Leu/Phe/Val dehydrogenase dimerization domain-containing protein n=2 Tax=Pseudomonadota TaxID=1224 RepID=UPI0023B81AD4